MTDLAERVAALTTAAQALVDSISFDDNGALIGGKWMGGHGGLISEETRKASDALRRELNRALLRSETAR